MPPLLATTGPVVKYDVSIPSSDVDAFRADAEVVVSARCPGATAWWFGHVCDDNLHLNVYAPTGAARGCVFTAAGLQYGHNVRNLLTLQALDVVGGSSRSMAGFGHPPSWTIAVTGALAIFGAIMPSYVRAVASANGRSTPESVGGRGTRNRVIVVAILVAQPAWGLVIVALLANAAALHRVAVSLAREPASGKDPTEQRP